MRAGSFRTLTSHALTVNSKVPIQTMRGEVRAATIIEKMEDNNIVSKPGRAGKREILIEDN